MSLCYREQRQLRGIEARLQGSDSHLAAMLEVFGRLYCGQDMPASEQVPSGHGRDRRAVTQIAAAFAAVALAISVMFSAALTLAASVRCARVRPSAGQPERTGPGREADGRQNPAR
jgi:Protein of unknown function (DUF3040)